MTQAVALAQQASTGVSPGFRNRIINGGMTIDQRNAGASVTPADNTYTLDRWQASQTVSSKFSVQQSSNVPAGFSNSMLITSLSAYSVASGEVFAMAQQIEGYNVADLNWGTANAKTITLSFWVRSSLTGTFGGALANSNVTRSYPFSYTISAANTWEYKTVTIAGDTSGTWQTTTSTGIRVWVGLGVGSSYSGTAGAWAGSDFRSTTGATSVVGTNGATFYITGVQLEVGSTATSFDYRPYGTELQLCQRYYQNTYNTGVAVGSVSSLGVIYRTLDATQSYASLQWQLPVKMRATPTTTYYSPFSGTSGKMGYNPGSVDVTTSSAGVDGMQNVATIINGISIGQSYGLYLHLTCSAEL
jgi:hypothetical protein